MTNEPTGKLPLEQNKSKIRDGRMMQGICSQWITDNAIQLNLNLELIGLYMAIARHTFGFRNRDGYIEQSLLLTHKNTLRRYRNKLTELGLIEWQATRAYTRYKILEPQSEIANFAFNHGSALASAKDDQPTPSSGPDTPTYNPNDDI